MADFEHVLDLLDALFADLRDVNQTVNVVLESNGRTKAGEFGDVAGDEITDLVILVNVLPRVLAQLFQAERNALVGLVHFQHDGFNFCFEVFPRCRSAPKKIREMNF